MRSCYGRRLACWKFSPFVHTTNRPSLKQVWQIPDHSVFVSIIFICVSTCATCCLRWLLQSLQLMSNLNCTDCGMYAVYMYERVPRWQSHRGGTAAAAPPPFRPSDPALCGSRPLVTPYYCRLGDLLCLFCVSFCVSLLSMYVYLVVFVVFFLFCSISFSTLILLVGSFDL